MTLWVFTGMLAKREMADDRTIDSRTHCDAARVQDWIEGYMALVCPLLHHNRQHHADNCLATGWSVTSASGDDAID